MRTLHYILVDLVVATLLTGCRGDAKPLICAYLDVRGKLGEDGRQIQAQQESGDIFPDNDSTGSGEIMPNNNTIRCPDSVKHCYALWMDDPLDKSKVTIMKRGCWVKSGGSPCSRSGECTTNLPPYSNHNNTKFCCCSLDMCNFNVSDGYVPGMHTTETPSVTPVHHYLHDQNYRQTTIIISLASVCSVAIVVVAVYAVYRQCLGSHKPPMESLNLAETPPTPNYELEQLKLSHLVDRGRYGEVWKGTLNDQDVAVKIFPAVYRQNYLNEKDIYCLPHIEHDSLLRFYGAEERLGSEGMTQYLLVLNYIPHGTLLNYLKDHVIDWSTLCRMCHSSAAGLSYLHTDISVGDKFKPAIAHRDFNSRNILVRNDLSCVVCDLGLAMKIVGSHFYRNGHEENAEQASLTDVGTLRYMSPEVLDGAVNLRDCEASLKQIDVYSLGLVLWEIATRCSDLYQGLPVPEFQLPYQAELGTRPTFEEIQLLVSRNKARPAFPPVWKDTNQAIRALKETIEDCWDQDAEARLTSMCVEERILEMATLWDSRHRGVTPTVNPTSNMGLMDRSLVQRNATGAQVPSSTVNMPGSDRDSADRNGNLPVGNLVDIPQCTSTSVPRYSRSVGETSVSASTTDTFLLSSPGDLDPFSKANCNVAYAKSNKVQMLQPHQGRNPTVERNTHKRSDEELAVMGNTLVLDSVKKKQEQQQRPQETNGQGMSSLTDELFDAIADNLESSLVQNDMLSQSRHNPIPYVQNQVHNGEIAMAARPKQPNVPGNGAVYDKPANEPKKSKMRFGMFGKSSGKDKNSKFSFFGLGGSKSKGNQNETSQPSVALPTVAPSHQPASMVPHEPERSNLQPRPVSTEVCLMNGTTVVRPRSLMVNGIAPKNIYNVDQDHVEQQHQQAENRLGIAEVGVAKLKSTSNGQPAVVKMQRKSQSNRDLSPSSLAKIQLAGLDPDDPKLRRPSSLSLYGHNYNSPNTVEKIQHMNGVDTNLQNGNFELLNIEKEKTPNNNNSAGDANSGTKIKKRVKTPFQMKKNGRFSLYDDRMMSQSYSDVSKPKEPGKLTKSSISLHQFGNTVDIDIDSLKAADFQV